MGQPFLVYIGSVLGTISLISLVIISIAHIKIPILRKPPGNLAKWHYIYLAIYATNWLTGFPLIYSLFQGLTCNLIKIVALYALATSWSYSIALKIQVFWTIKSIHGYKSKRSIIWHVMAQCTGVLITLIGFTIEFFLEQKNDTQLYPICFFYTSSISFMGSIFYFMCVPILVLLLVYSKRLKSNQEIYSRLKPYQRVVIIGIFVLTPIATRDFLQYLLSPTFPQWSQLVRFIQIFLVMISLWGVFGFAARVKDFDLFKKIIKAAFCIKSRDLSESTASQESLLTLHQLECDISLQPLVQKIHTQNIENLLATLTALFSAVENPKFMQMRTHREWTFETNNDQRVRITEYFWKEFAQIREFDQLNKEEILNSVGSNLNLDNLEAKSKNPGGKGFGFMFFTWDNKFILKTLNINQAKRLKQLLNPLNEKILSEGSLIARFYGFFRFRFQNLKYNVVMIENIFSQAQNSLKFDVKGSEKNRQESFQDFEFLQELPRNKVYKDKDFKNIIRSIQFNEKDKQFLFHLLQTDTSILQYYKIMDYSLIIGLIPSQELKTSFHNKYRFTCNIHQKEYIAYLAIIDCLQKYTVLKRIEKSMKSIKYNQKKISVMAPGPYRTRFLQFLKSSFLSPGQKLDINSE